MKYPIMDDGSRLPWIIAIVLLFGAMFFAVTETSFAASSRPRLKAISEIGNKKATLALALLDDFDRVITTILIGTNIIHLSIASIVTIAVTKSFGMNAVAVSTIITTMAVFFAGEMLPKTIAKKMPEQFAMACAKPLKFFMVVFSPLSALLSAAGNSMSRIIKGEPELSVTEDELYDIIEDMTEEGKLDEEAGELISSALEFGDLTVETILTPRVDIVAVNADDNIDSILSVIKGCNHSRLPVYQGTIDNIIGIISIRSFIKAYIKQKDNLNIRTVISEPFFIHQSEKVDDLLPMMSASRQNIAIVTDNYGGVKGFITIEDILEELVGEIWDEDDVVEEPIIKISDTEISADADVRVSDVFDELDFEDPGDDAELIDKVLGAWVFETFGKIPHVGDEFEYDKLTITVSAMNHNRITRVKVRCNV